MAVCPVLRVPPTRAVSSSLELRSIPRNRSRDRVQGGRGVCGCGVVVRGPPVTPGGEGAGQPAAPVGRVERLREREAT